MGRKKICFINFKYGFVAVVPSRQLLRRLVEPVHDVGHCAHGLQDVVVGAVAGVLVEHDKDAVLLKFVDENMSSCCRQGKRLKFWCTQTPLFHNKRANQFVCRK